MRVDEVEQLDEFWGQNTGKFGIGSYIPFTSAKATRVATNKAANLSATKVKKFATANTAKWVTVLQNLKQSTPGMTPDQLNQAFANFIKTLKVPETDSMDLTKTDPNKSPAVFKLFSAIGSTIAARRAATPPAPTPAEDMAALYARFAALLAKGSPLPPGGPLGVPESRYLKEELTPEEQKELDTLYAELVKRGGEKDPKIAALLAQYNKAKGAAPAGAATRPEEAGMDPAASQKTTDVGPQAKKYIDYLTKAIGEEPDMAARVAMVKKYINAIINDTKAAGTYKFAMKPMQDIIAQHEFDLGGAESDVVKKAKAAIASAKPMESKIYRQLKKILEAHGITFKSLGYSVLVMESKSEFVYISKRR